LHKELDADRIARLREMNKHRLEALEAKLLDLHRQKYDMDGEFASASLLAAVCACVFGAW